MEWRAEQMKADNGGTKVPLFVLPRTRQLRDIESRIERVERKTMRVLTDADIEELRKNG